MSDFDPFAARPRQFCEDCGFSLSYGDLSWARRFLELADMVQIVALCGPQALVYRCPHCGMYGAFSPAQRLSEPF